MRSQGAYFEGDCSVIFLCIMFLGSCISFNKYFCFSYYMVGYFLDKLPPILTLVFYCISIVSSHVLYNSYIKNKLSLLLWNFYSCCEKIWWGRGSIFPYEFRKITSRFKLKFITSYFVSISFFPNICIHSNWTSNFTLIYNYVLYSAIAHS